MFKKKIKNKTFEYQPRYYKPEADEIERRKRKLKFRSSSTAVRKKRNPIIWFIVLAIIAFVYLKLSGSF